MSDPRIPAPADAPDGDATRQDKPARSSQPRVAPDFGPRYRVVAAIGKGGMGEVYRAHDVELQAEVALKIVRDDQEASLARFRREIALARRVTSPNVLRVYDLEEHDGLRFLSMELVDGDDLAAIMRRDGKLPLPRALAIFRQVCVGLAAAHEQDVVHRDLKPQNVLVDKQDNVRVADFGLARSLDESGLTVTGAIVGSPAYMSPEQVKGEASDERSDIYSLGVMLYQLVTGEPPFRAETAHAVMEMRLHKRPPLLRDIDPTLPAHLEGICAKCLALAPSARYPSVRALLAELDTPRPTAAPAGVRPRRRHLFAAAGSVFAVAVAITALCILRRSRDQPQPGVTVEATAPIAPRDAATRPMVIVIAPVENGTGNPLFDRTIESLMTDALRRSERLDPILEEKLQALGLARPGTTDRELMRAVAAEEGTDAVVLRGSVARVGANISIALAVTDVDGTSLWQGTSGNLADADVVPACGRLALQIRTALGERAAAKEPPATDLSPVLAADHEWAVASGIQYVNDTASIIDHYERALALDPDFAIAHWKLAIELTNRYELAKARAHYELALRGAPALGRRNRLTLQGDAATVAGDYSRAIASFEELLQTWPSDAIAEQNLIGAFMASHNFQRGAQAARVAVAQHPRSAPMRANAAICEVMVGNFERGAELFGELITNFPHPSPDDYTNLFVAEYLLGHDQEARAAIAKVAAIDAAYGRLETADLDIARGRRKEAIGLLEQAAAYDVSHHNTDYADADFAELAELELERGDRKSALVSASKVTGTSSAAYIAARVSIAAGNDKRAIEIRDRLARSLSPDLRAYAKLTDARLAGAHGKPSDAIASTRDALAIANLWLAHIELAQYAFDARDFATAETETRALLERRGEIGIGFPDQRGSAVRYVPALTYALARAQDSRGDSAAAKASYSQFLAMMADADPDDPLIADSVKRSR